MGSLNVTTFIQRMIVVALELWRQPPGDTQKQAYLTHFQPSCDWQHAGRYSSCSNAALNWVMDGT